MIAIHTGRDRVVLGLLKGRKRDVVVIKSVGEGRVVVMKGRCLKRDLD
jgi:hypothetical protein